MGTLLLPFRTDDIDIEYVEAIFAFSQSHLNAPSVDTGDFEPLSQVTAASLEDIGYEVSFEAVDQITAADLSPSCRCDHQLRRFSGWKQISDDTSHRRLAAATEAEAKETARRFLRSRSVDESLLPESVRYVGDKVVMVFVEQDDTMYNVVVTK